MSIKIQVTGLCRFSYPTCDASGFATSADLYNMHRLAARLDIFKRLWVPSISQQTDKRFQIIILIGSNLPENVRDDLIEIASRCEQIHLHTEDEYQPHKSVCSKILRSYRDPAAEFFAEFALDDDDAVAIDFIEQIYRHWPVTSWLAAEHGRAELDFSRGYAAHFNEHSIRLKEVAVVHWNCGQVIFQRKGSRLSLFDFHHFRFWKKHPRITLPHTPMFIRSFHASNDSGDRWDRIPPEASKISTAELPKHLRDRFGAQLPEASVESK